MSNYNSSDNEVAIFDTKEYVLVIASTLNQMVNYIPLRNYQFKEVYNLTLYLDKDRTEKVKENKKWDTYLYKVFGKSISEIKIVQKEFLKIDLTITEFEGKPTELNNKKVIWNLTGGQRPYLLAVWNFVYSNRRKEDRFLYLEGNTNEAAFVNPFSSEVKTERYFLPEGTKINHILELMGFNHQSNLESSRVPSSKDIQFWTDFYDKYKALETKLRSNLMKLNKPDEYEKNVLWESIEAILNIKPDTYNPMKSDKKITGNNYPFGYILEEMAYHILYNTIHKAVFGIYCSVRTYNDEISKQLDEFDILIITNQGKIINFECKSGGMDGDVAKSTKYSTLAITGVYGLPILITPLLEYEILNKKSLTDSIFKNSIEAIGSAESAGMEVWGIDKLKDNIEKLIK